MPDIYSILSNLLSGLLGALFGGWVAGRYMIWQTRETALHNLRSIVIRMAVHVEKCRGTDRGDEHDRRTDPWTTTDMDEAIAAYQRYRALLLPLKRSALDRAWTVFQGIDPNGSTPYAHTQMIDFQDCSKRVQTILAAIA